VTARPNARTFSVSSERAHLQLVCEACDSQVQVSCYCWTLTRSVQDAEGVAHVMQGYFESRVPDIMLLVFHPKRMNL
jgi:hypothetical protein